MKRFFALAALVLGLAACQTEPEGLNVNVGGEQLVTVNVTIPEAETRAGGNNSALGVFDNGVLGTADDNTTMRYILQVYYNGVASKERLVEYSDGKTANFEVRLVPGRNYQFVVWADVVVNGEQDIDNHYVTKDANGVSTLNDIKLNGEWNAMDESRDAFTATELIENYSGASNINITLKRPFAKLRVVTTDIKNLTNLGIVPTAATVEYKTTHRVAFNALEGKAADATESKTHSYTINPYSNESNTGAEYTLFTDYFFAENDVVKFNFNVYEDEAKTKLIKSNPFQTDIYVKRNYLTTIKGNILTDGKSFDVTIEDAFAGELGEENGKTFANVDTAEELLDAINKGVANIILDGDIDLNDLLGAGILSTRAAEPTYGLLIPAGKSVVLDLKGFTISQSKECKASYSMIQNNGNLTIIDSSEAKSGKISFKDTSAGDPSFGWGSYTISNYGDTLVVENGTIEHLGEQNTATEVKHMICAIFQYSGSTTINGGTISTPTYRSVRLWKGDMTINGGNFNGQVWVQAVDDSSNLTINGGTFAPRGKDGSSIFITNGEYEVQFAVTGGFFNTKIGCTDANKAGVKGCIVGGTFTASAIENTNAALIANGHTALNNGDDTYTVINLRGSEVEIYGLTLKPNGDNSKIVVNDKEGFLNLTKLFNNWTALFTDGNGTTYTNYAKGAGVDYYYAGRWTVSLEADIDLNNATISPIIIKHPVSTGSPAFEGNNHTIKNAKIATDTATENEAGLFVSSPCGFNDLKLDNIHVTGSNVGNSTAGVLTGSNRVGIDNITITNSSVEGGKYTGGVIGYGYTDVTNCKLTNVSVKGGYKLGGLIGYICASGTNTGEVTGNTLTNCSVDGIGNGIYAGGKDKYIIGMLVGNYNCNGTCQDNVVYDMTTTTTKIIGEIEAGKVVNESNNIVTYVVENYEELKTAVINGGKIELANDITVDEWIMFSEDYNISSGQIINIDEMNVTIDGKDHTLTVNAIESAGNGNLLFQGASVLNISNLTIKYADGLAGGLGMDSGVIKNVHFIGGGNTIYPRSGEILVEECIFDNNGNALYFEHECDNLTVTGCTFNQKADQNVILLRGDVKFTDNIVNSGRTVNVVSGSPVVTGNNFNDVRFKVYGAATATISNNIINNLDFDGTTYASTFTNNTLSSAAQAVLDSKTKVN